MELTTVAAPPGINKRIVCNGVYPNELTIRAPNAVTPPLQIYEAALYAIPSAHESQIPPTFPQSPPDSPHGHEQPNLDVHHGLSHLTPLEARPIPARLVALEPF
jgi:hypothetical protein